MKTIILLLAVCFSAFIIPQGRRVMTDTEKKLEEIRIKFIPDKRVAAFYYDIREESGISVISGGTDNPSLKKQIEEQFSGPGFQTRIELLPSKELGDKLFGVINLSVANIRTKPDHAAEMATQALLGHPVKIFQKKGGWYLIQTPDNYVGWVDDDGVQLMNDKELMEWKASNKIIYLKTFGTAYSKNDITSVPSGDLVKGNILKKISDEGEFITVEYPDKRIAYITSSEAVFLDEFVKGLSPDGNQIISTAYNFMGIPYLWGGTSVKGMDCSGFTKTVYYLNGLVLQRDASQQVFSGDEIDITDGFDRLQPGDLLFFGSKATDSTKERVTHVAIYIGHGDFIHASGSVKINSLDKSKDNFSSYRFNTLLRAKRVLNAENQEGISRLKDLYNINGIQP